MGPQLIFWEGERGRRMSGSSVNEPATVKHFNASIYQFNTFNLPTNVGRS
jgi:hypothetical protein